MSGNQQQAYYILQPNAPMVDKTGHITREWWRFLNSLFVTGGSGQSTGSLVDLENAVAGLEAEVATQGQPSGPDYGLAISEQLTAFAADPQMNGRVAEIEGSLRDLAILLATLPRPQEGVQPGTEEWQAGVVTALGPELVLSGGTLDSIGPIYAPLVNGDLPGPTAIADGFGQFIMVPIT